MTRQAMMTVQNSFITRVNLTLALYGLEWAGVEDETGEESLVP